MARSTSPGGRSPAVQSSRAQSSRAQSKDAIRRTNLAALLTAVRTRGALSRADLVAELGLGRTTVAELVMQLRAAGLVLESEPLPASGAGRPSYRVAASPAVGAIAVNPEADVVTAAFVGLDGSIASRQQEPTPRDASPEAVARACAALIDAVAGRLPAGHRVLGVGCAIPGQVVLEAGLVTAAPRLGWRDVGFASLLAAATGHAVRLDNNARLATQAEHRLRPDVTDLVSLFAGAGGIGAGIVSGGVLLRGSHGFAGELGHVRMSDDPSVDYDGKRGTIEAVLKRTELTGVLGLEADAGDAEISAALAAPPASAGPALARLAAALGTAVGNIANALDPQLVLLGGFLGPLLVHREPQVRAALREVALDSIASRLRVEAVAEISDSVLLGAAELVLAGFASDPRPALR